MPVVHCNIQPTNPSTSSPYEHDCFTSLPKLVERWTSINKFNIFRVQDSFLDLLAAKFFSQYCSYASSLLTTIVVTTRDMIGLDKVVHQKGNIGAWAREWGDGILEKEMVMSCDKGLRDFFLIEGRKPVCLGS